MVTGLIAEVLLIPFFTCTLCNGLKIGEVKHKASYFTFESVIDSWGARIVRTFVATGVIAEVLLVLFFICITV